MQPHAANFAGFQGRGQVGRRNVFRGERRRVVADSDDQIIAFPFNIYFKSAAFALVAMNHHIGHGFIDCDLQIRNGGGLQT